MHLRKIELKDWKAYVSASVELPRPRPGQNVVLIGAKNGYGKTSLFEALVLELFGQDGLPIITRAHFGLSSDDHVKISYNNFLSGALHRAVID
jgi:DNA sulfur modification protein DndD